MDLSDLLSTLAPGGERSKCRDCQAPVYWLRSTPSDRNPVVKSKTFNPDGTAHWRTCTGEKSVAFRAGRDGPSKCKTCDVMVEWRECEDGKKRPYAGGAVHKCPNYRPGGQNPATGQGSRPTPTYVPEYTDAGDEIPF